MGPLFIVKGAGERINSNVMSARAKSREWQEKNWIRLHDASVCARRSCTQVLILPCGDAKYRVGGGRWLSQLERLTASVSPLFVNVIYLSNDCDCDGDVFSECAHIRGGHTAARQPLLNFSKHTKLCICDSLNYTMLSLSLSLRRLRKSCTACDHWSGLRLCALAMVTLVLLRLLHIYYCHVVCHVIFVMGGGTARVATAQTAFSIQCCRMKSFPCWCYTVAKRG